MASSNVPAAMLAQHYTPARVSFPCHLQPKLNGVRCLAVRGEDTVTLWTRNGHEITSLDHLKPDLMRLLRPGDVADGEIYQHGRPLQEISGLVRKKVGGNGQRALEYWIFDMVSDDPFYRRHETLKERFCDLGSYDARCLCLVTTHQVRGEGHVDDWLSHYMSSGHEGVILRDSHAPYIGSRTPALMKYKRMVDAEYEIVDTLEAAGKDAGSIIFVCKTDKGIRFNARPAMPLHTRREMWAQRHTYIGKQLTVQYQELTNAGVPMFPVGVAIRDYE